MARRHKRCHIASMTAKDRWTVSLKCPNGHGEGEAELWQEDGWSFSNGDQSTHLESVPDGFRAVATKRSFDFFCKLCGAPAERRGT